MTRLVVLTILMLMLYLIPFLLPTLAYYIASRTSY